MIFLINIDQIRQAERERQELSETLASLFESTPDAVLTVNAAGRIERVNKQAEKDVRLRPSRAHWKADHKAIPGDFPKGPAPNAKLTP